MVHCASFALIPKCNSRRTDRMRRVSVVPSVTPSHLVRPLGSFRTSARFDATTRSRSPGFINDGTAKQSDQLICIFLCYLLLLLSLLYCHLHLFRFQLISTVGCALEKQLIERYFKRSSSAFFENCGNRKPERVISTIVWQFQC